MNGSISGHVLVIGDDMRIFLAVVRSLGRAGKIVHAAPFNWHSPALKSKYIAVVHHFPRYSDDPASWRQAVLNAMRICNFDLVIPCCDRAILPFDIHRAEFAEYCIAVPDANAIRLLFDKERTRGLCNQLSIPTTAGINLGVGDNARGLVSSFGLPLVLKARQSYSLDRLDSVGKVWIVESERELSDLLKRIKEPSEHLVERYFDGVGVGVSVLAKGGRILHAFQHRRLREGRGGSSSYRISEPINEALYGACVKICEHTRMTGVCMFEFRYNLKTHDWILLETNARFWGSLALPLSLGVNFPLFLYDLLVKGTEHKPVRYREGTRARNLVLDSFNLIQCIRSIRRDQIGFLLADLGDYLTQPIRWLTGSERSDTFVIDDLRPGVWEFLTLIRSIGQKLVRNSHPELTRRRSEQTI